MASNTSSTTGKRRRPSDTDAPIDSAIAHDSSSSDDEVGPALPDAAPSKKKRRVLRHESLYVAALPQGTRYSRSLMHTNQLAYVTFTPNTDFLITASINGVVAFWKKGTGGEHVEFVKNFGAHLEDVVGTACSWDGKSYATCSKDKTIKVWDVATFDMVGAITLMKTLSCICFVNGRGGGGSPLVAVGNEVDGDIEVYDGTGSENKPLYVIKGVHRKPLSCLAYNVEYDCVISADDNGMVEYWQPGPNAEKPHRVFEIKSKTDLFDFRKAKSAPVSISISPNGRQFAAFSFPDRKVRLFDFASGKLYRTYDESITTINEMQQAGTALTSLEDIEFGKRMTVERELDNPIVRKRMNVIFDETGNFIMYGSLFGTKVINTLTNRVVKVYGQEEKLRPLNLTLYQGQPEQKGVVTVQMAASDNPLLREAEARDSMLVATAQGKVRFYMFTNEQEVSKPTRDIRNEKLERTNDTIQGAKSTKAASLASAAVIHTTLGDVHLRLFPDAAPKTVENFVTHCRNGYYNNVIFHRVIKKFMIQTGDPMGDGTGGESIWGGNFEDEITSLKHDKPYTLSMANAGPNTNGSQFFITTVKTPWLDNKHTVFGRAVQGLDVVHGIENAKTLRHEKPEQDIKIVNISVT